MTRVFTIAIAEFLRLARSKAFIIGILLMPVLFGVMMLFTRYAERHVDLEDRRLAVVDGTGVLYDRLAAAADEFNKESGEGANRTGPHFITERIDQGSRDINEVKLDLSNRVRKKQLFAFVVIPPTALTAGATAKDQRDQARMARWTGKTSPDDKDLAKKNDIQYYTETIAYDAMPDWLTATLNDEISKRRFAAAGIEGEAALKLTAHVDLATFGLVARGADGAVSEAKEVDAIATMGPPIFFLVLMFMTVMTSAQHLLNAIIEEKMSRICEVLLGSVSPFQLLMGKLLGVSGVSVLLALIYFAGATFFVFESGRWELLHPGLMAWFIVFLICAALMFGAMFLALGSACASISDAQSLLQPAMMLMLLGYLGSFVAIRAPDSGLAVGMSLFPTMAPFTMMLRMAIPPGVPWWQVLLSITILIATTGVVVWAASRVFRIGILMQGKAPTLPELLRWVRADQPDRIRVAEAE
jgi:ABC-2 type transport system permease protein